MAYRIAPDEPAAAGLRRCVLEQIDRAEGQLDVGLRDDPAKAVHEARKALKRARSALRMGREAFGTERVRTELDALRGTAGRLSAARDADVSRGVLEDVAGRGVGRLPEASWHQLARALEARASQAAPGRAVVGEAERARAELAEARRRIAAWPQRDPDAFKAVLGGLRRAQDRGRRALEAAGAGEDPEARHDLRKRVKDAWYHLGLLEELWPGPLGAQADEAHRLSDLLGDEHDLAVLADLVDELAIPVDLEPVHAMIRRRREALWAEALPLARRLYAERPGALVRRLMGYRSVGSSSGSTSSNAGTGSPTTLR